MPRIMSAIAAAIALHAGALVFRPDVSGRQVSATTSSTAMAVRMVNSATSNLTPLPGAKLASPPLRDPPADHESHAASSPRARAALNANGLRELETERQVPGSQVGADSTAKSILGAASDYAFAIDLNPGPRPLDEIDPEYPDTVKLRSGTVVLRLLISATGHVDDVAVVRAEPAGVFDQAAIDAFSKARFDPGIAGGVPVKSQIRVEVEFMPINRGARISGRSY